MSDRQVACPSCGEDEDLSGRREDARILLTCGRCGHEWMRRLDPRCSRCGSDDLQTVPVAIVEKSRGTQLSVVGIRTVEMCWTCDRETIRRWQDNRPNPLLPSELPNSDHLSGE
ncbi:MAG: hypothetical protein ACLFWM_02030 [Actinomycetota bacterium]